MENRKNLAQKQYDVFVQEKRRLLKEQNEIEMKIKQLRGKRAELLQKLDELESSTVREITTVDDLVW